MKRHTNKERIYTTLYTPGEHLYCRLDELHQSFPLSPTASQSTALLISDTFSGAKQIPEQSVRSAVRSIAPPAEAEGMDPAWYVLLTVYVYRNRSRYDVSQIDSSRYDSKPCTTELISAEFS